MSTEISFYNGKRRGKVVQLTSSVVKLGQILRNWITNLYDEYRKLRRYLCVENKINVKILKSLIIGKYYFARYTDLINLINNAQYTTDKTFKKTMIDTYLIK